MDILQYSRRCRQRKLLSKFPSGWNSLLLDRSLWERSVSRYKGWRDPLSGPRWSGPTPYNTNLDSVKTFHFRHRLELGRKWIYTYSGSPVLTKRYFIFGNQICSNISELSGLFSFSSFRKENLRFLSLQTSFNLRERAFSLYKLTSICT